MFECESDPSVACLPFKDPLQNQGASVGRLFIIPRPQPQEAGAGVGGTATQITDSTTS